LPHSYAGSGITRETGTNVIRLREWSVSNAVRLERAIFSSLLLSIALAAVPYGAVEPWWEAGFEASIYLLGGCWVLTVILRSGYSMPAILWPVAGVVGLALIQTVPIGRLRISGNLVFGATQAISGDPFETRRFIFKLVAVAIALAILAYSTTGHRRLQTLMHLVMVIGALSAVFALLRRFLPAQSLASFWQGKLEGESFGQFMNRNHFALLMEMSIGPTLALAYLAGTRGTRFLYGTALLLIWVALVLANSRGGLVSLLGQFAVLSWMAVRSLTSRFSPPQTTYYRSRGRRLLAKSRTVALRSTLLLFLLGAAFASSLWLGGDEVRQRLETVPAELVPRSSEPARSTRRLEIWAPTWSLIKAHPFLGSGLGAYKTVISGYFVPSNEWQPEQAHNEYLELLAGGGCVGGALGVWFLFLLYREVRRRLYEGDRLQQVVCLGAVLSLVGVAIDSLVDFGLHVLVNALVCSVLFVLATANARSNAGPATVSSR
jgi:O-antigen ligase